MNASGGGRGYVERTIGALIDALERSRAAERTTTSPGLLQPLDARVKVAGLLALVGATVLSTNLRTIAAILTLAVVGALASRLRLAHLATGVWLGAFAFTGAMALPALFLTPGRPALHLPLVPWPITEQGLRTAVLLLLRVETAATLGFLLVFTTPWTHVLKALRVFRVPVVFVVVLGMTYRYGLLLLETARDLFEAQRSRTVSRPRGAARARVAAGHAAVLLSKTLALSGEVYLAMQARGFRGEVHVLDEFRMTRRDWVALSSFAALAVAAVWAGR